MTPMRSFSKLYHFRFSVSGRNLDDSLGVAYSLEVVISPLCHEAESSAVLRIRQKRLQYFPSYPHVDYDRMTSK